jgi:diacylglycerol kinase (ATP)
MRNKFLGTGTPGIHPIRKIKVILSGLYYAVIMDFSVAYKIILSIPVLGVCFFFRQWLDFHLILLATGIVLIAEMFNSAIEAVCDFVENKEDERIRIIKDISAAATGISILVWAFILIIEVSHLWVLHEGYFKILYRDW